MKWQFGIKFVRQRIAILCRYGVELPEVKLYLTKSILKLD